MCVCVSESTVLAGWLKEKPGKSQVCLPIFTHGCGSRFNSWGYAHAPCWVPFLSHSHFYVLKYIFLVSLVGFKKKLSLLEVFFSGV